MTEQSLNTHFYDRKLDEIYSDTIKSDNKEMGDVGNFTEIMPEVYTQLNNFIDTLSSKNTINNSVKNNAKRMLNNIKNSKSKIDPVNNMNIEELLFRLNRLIQKEIKDNIDDSIKRLEYIVEQISDIITKGSCLQGQSIRLFSCLKAFY